MTLLLLKPVTDKAGALDAIADGVLRVWAESHGSLRDEVVAFFEEESLLDGGGDYTADTVLTSPPESRWDDATNKLIERHPDFSKDDLLLMSYYISGRMPDVSEESESLDNPDSPPELATPDETGIGVGEILAEIRERLLSMPRDDSFEQLSAGLIDEFLDRLRIRCLDGAGDELQSLDFNRSRQRGTEGQVHRADVSNRTGCRSVQHQE